MITETELLKMKENGQFPDESVKIKDTQGHSVDVQWLVRGESCLFEHMYPTYQSQIHFSFSWVDLVPWYYGTTQVLLFLTTPVNHNKFNLKESKRKSTIKHTDTVIYTLS